MRAIIQKSSDPFPAMAAQRKLRIWYRRHRRDLPWRRTRDPYRIWVSEVMLQQTQVRTVIPYYRRFLARFPTLRSLARARPDAVLAAWSGLGYYRRARNFHAAARRIEEDHRGSIPRDVELLLRLPGVGRYTAGALASIAFDRPAPALDGNAARVLVRLLALHEDPASAGVRRRLEALVRGFMRGGRPSEITQGLMELGALVCTPASPSCERCPLAGECRARILGLQAALPMGRRTRPTEDREAAVAILRKGSALLMVRRRKGELLEGLWEFPGDFLRPREGAGTGLRRVGQERLGRTIVPGRTLATLSQTITYRRIRVRAYDAALGEPVPPGWSLPRDARWLSAQRIERLPHGSATARILRVLRNSPRASRARSMTPVEP